MKSIKIATDNGIKVIVIDHHEPNESQTNSADAILDPLSYLHRHNILLETGCGVGFKFIHALLLRNKMDINILYSYLDLVALSTACDLVPLHGENRVLMYFGISAIKKHQKTSIAFNPNWHHGVLGMWSHQNVLIIISIQLLY